MKCVGHRGAGELAEPNSLLAFRAAQQAGADMIEFDVVRLGGILWVAHSRLQVLRGPRRTLQAVLGELARPDYAGLDFNVDLKRPGYEAATVDMLRRYGLLERCLFSSQHARALDRVRRIDPSLQVGLSIGGWISRAWHHRRRRLQRWLLDEARQGRWQALMIHHRYLSADLAYRLRQLEVQIYTWTVDDLVTLQRMRQLDLAGFATNNPLLVRHH